MAAMGRAARASTSASIRTPPTLLVLDDVDVLAPADAPAHEPEARAVAKLAVLLDAALGRRVSEGAIFVLACCTHPARVSPLLCRAGRLHAKIELGLPTPAEREQFARAWSERACAAGLLDEAAVLAAAACAHGLTIAQLEGALGGVVRARVAAESPHAEAGAPLGSSAAPARPIAPRELLRAVRRTRREQLLHAHEADGAAASAAAGGAEPSYEGPASSDDERDGTPPPRQQPPAAAAAPLDRLPGLRGAAARLRLHVVRPILEPELLRAWGAPPLRGVLIYGPAGCGKSALAHAAAAESTANVLSVQAANVLGAVVGSSEAAVRALFARARAAAPCILILDHIEALAPVRGHDTSSARSLDRTLSVLLSEMDGVGTSSGDLGATGALGRQVVVIAIAEHRDALDPAILRPGRLDEHIELGLPDSSAREAILRWHARAMPLAADVDMRELAQRTHGFSGAELQNVVREAGVCCLRRAIDEGRDGGVDAGPVGRSHFVHALARCHALAAHCPQRSGPY